MDRGAWQDTVHGVAKELDMTCNYTTTTINQQKHRSLLQRSRKYKDKPVKIDNSTAEIKAIQKQ